MKLNNLRLITGLLILLMAGLTGCEEAEEPETDPVEINFSSIAPSSTKSRANNYLGCIEISSRSVTISVWDHGQIDGDIISLIANGETILSNHELDGPLNSKTIKHKFGDNGFNYLVLYAHNEGSISPNTATISLNGQEFILESNLSTNGYVDIVVTGFGVNCSNSSSGGGTSSGSGSGSGTGSTNNSSVVFWTGQDWGCGNISVDLTNVGSGIISTYYTAGNPDCGDSGNANFSSLAAGTYSFSATCDSYSWGSSFTLEENSCLTYELQ